MTTFIPVFCQNIESPVGKDGISVHSVFRVSDMNGMICPCPNYQTGMNLLDIASYANANLDVYCLVLILANLILLPSAILLYKQSDISLKEEIFDKSTLSKDIVHGIILAGTSSVISLFALIVMRGRTNLAFGGWDRLTVVTWMLKIGLTLVFKSNFGDMFMYQYSMNAPDEMRTLHEQFYGYLNDK